MSFNRNTMQGKAIPAWLVFLTGILVGAFSAFLYYLSLHDLGEDAPDLVKKSLETISKFKEKVQSSNEPIVDSSDMKFDFYTILPDLEMIVQKSLSASKTETETETQIHTPTPTPKVLKTEIKPNVKAEISSPQLENFILQAGSFKSVKQAGKLKHRLYDLGIITNIQKVTFKNKDTWYRVRVGPIPDHNAILKIQEILKKNKINSLLMKVNG